jgi:molybdate transport system regulatory protein
MEEIIIMEIKYKIWLEDKGMVLFGHGRGELLKAIDECHCLSTAAKKLNMSYRAAWGRLRASETRLGVKLVDMQTHGEGSRLTAEAKVLLDKFELLEKETSTFLLDMGRKLSLLDGHKAETPLPNKTAKTLEKLCCWFNTSFINIQSLHMISHALEYL